MLVNSQDARSTVPVMDLTMVDTESDTASENSAPSPHPSSRMANDSPEPSVAEPDSLLGESDTESLPGTDVAPEEIEEEPAIDFPVHQRAVRVALQDLDECELGTLFESRAHTMRTVPFFLRGAFRAAMRMSMEEIVSGWNLHDEVKQERGWKLFFLLPRMLLSRPCRGGLVPRKKLETRFQKFFAGDWLDLISDAESVSRQALSARVRKRRRRTRPDGNAARAESLAMMGELSAARQALGVCRGCARGQEHVERSEEPGTPSASSQGATSSRVDDCDACPTVRPRRRHFLPQFEECQTRSCARAIGHDLRTSATVAGI